MPAKQDFGNKLCLECGNLIVHKVKRDINRKKFCSRNCLGIFTVKYKLPSNHMLKLWDKCNTAEANAKKSNKGKNHPLYIEDRTKIKSKRPRFENTQWTKQIFERDNYTCRICGILS